MSEYVRQPVKDWHEILAEKDAEIQRLRGSITDALFELEEGYLGRVLSILEAAIKVEAPARARAAIAKAKEGGMIITIPAEALEAGKDSAFAWLRSHMEDDVRVQQMTDEELTELVSAACLAMIQSWPGMRDSQHLSFDGHTETAIILPLTENTNAEG